MPRYQLRNTTKQASPVNVRTTLAKRYSSYTYPRFAALEWVVTCITFLEA